MSKHELSVPQQHQLKIAKATLRLPDVGARLMGGLTKDAARDFLRSIGWSNEQITKHEAH